MTERPSRRSIRNVDGRVLLSFSPASTLQQFQLQDKTQAVLSSLNDRHPPPPLARKAKSIPPILLALSPRKSAPLRSFGHFLRKTLLKGNRRRQIIMCYPCTSCGKCGAELPPRETRCPRCGKTLTADRPQCPDCGWSLPLPPGQAPAKRPQQ